MDLATRLEAHLLEVIQALQEQHLESESDAIEDNLTPESRLVLRGLANASALVMALHTSWVLMF